MKLNCKLDMPIRNLYMICVGIFFTGSFAKAYCIFFSMSNPKRCIQQYETMFKHEEIFKFVPTITYSVRNSFLVGGYCL
jgi:hypothetical protein